MRLPRPYSIKEIADLLGATYSGDENYLVNGVNEFHQVEKGDLTFIDNVKYYERVLFSPAAVVIINSKPEESHGKHFIISEDPFRDYNKFIKQFSTFKQSAQSISSSAEIGKNTIIQPNTFIGDNVKIGDNCIVHSNVSIYNDCEIGNNVVIHSNTVIGADAFYYKRKPEGFDKLISCGKVIIKDFVEIGANCTIDRGISGNTIIGEGTKLDNLIQIAHDVNIGRNCLLASQVGVAGNVTIEDDVILWGQVGIQKEITIGKGAVVLGQSGVPKSLEGGKTYFGSPAAEAREKMKEIAYMKQIPVLMKILTEKL
jgi:UDP-3-O-[3-hydroxymyristoyl] glucosamine N-acyltransferase